MRSKISSLTIIFGVLAMLAFSCSKQDDKPPEPVTDIDGNIYKTVKAGNWTWMAENLKTTKYNDGTSIPLVTNNQAWGKLTTPGYCWYINDEKANKDSYGALYNFYTVNTGNLCPTGWHVPSRDEWQNLRTSLGDTIKGGGKLKEEGTTNWHAPNNGADNSSGFTALPAGIRYLEGTFSTLYYYTGIWSSTENDPSSGWYMSLYYRDAIVTINYLSKKSGFSVRCMKDYLLKR